MLLASRAHRERWHHEDALENTPWVSLTGAAGVLYCVLRLIPSFFAPRENGAVSEFARRFDMLMPAAIATSLLLVILVAVYTWILARRPDLQTGEKIGIPAVLLVTNGILLPVVWWFYIWRDASIAGLSRRPSIASQSNSA